MTSMKALLIISIDVGEWSLGSPTGWGVDAEDEGLDALLDLLVGKVVNLNEWGEISIEGTECLSSRPFVLHNAKEVDHLVAKSAQMASWGRGDFAWDAA